MSIRLLYKYLLPKLIVKLMPSARKSVSVGDHSRIMPGGNFSYVTFGRYSYCGYFCRMVHCDIGSFCSIADKVTIGGAAHPLSHVSTSPVFHSGRNVTGRVFFAHEFKVNSKTEIGNDVWVGIGAIILSGVKIGDGAAIGAGSVVTKDVPPYEVWAGNPAKFIRKRFSDQNVKALLRIQWWNWDEEKLYKYAPYFGSPEQLIAEVDAE